MGIKEQTFMAAGEKLLIFIHGSTMPATARSLHTLSEKNARERVRRQGIFYGGFSSNNASPKRNNLSFTTEQPPSGDESQSRYLYEKDASRGET
jgi:hypothetical protein